MRLIIATAAIVGVLVGIMPSEASAWYCEARGGTGASGWGTSYYLANARRIALRQCAVRTPRGYMCYVTGCRP
jgi:hypothetical protein